MTASKITIKNWRDLIMLDWNTCRVTTNVELRIFQRSGDSTLGFANSVEQQKTLIWFICSVRRVRLFEE